MRKRQCSVCGRNVEQLDEAILSGKHWFCSASHFLEWEGRSKRRRAPRRIALSIISLALVVGFVVQLVARNHPRGTRVSADDLFQGFGEAIQQSTRENAHPYLFRVRLSPAAAKVADEFMRAEFVAHDCGALHRLSATLHLSSTTVLTPGSDCAFWLTNDRENDAHLVRGSRVIAHDCGGGAALLGIPVESNECFKYAIEGRYVTNDDGSRDPECDGSYTEVLPKQFDGTWRIVAETDVLNWGGGCLMRDRVYWKRRIPWTS